MSEAAIIEILTEHSEYFVTNSIPQNFFRWLGWEITKGLASFTDTCSQLYDWTFGLVDITQWSKFNNFINEFRPLIVALLYLGIVIVGFMMILGTYKKNTIIYSLLIFAVVVTASNYMFSTLNDVSILFKNAVAGTVDDENSYDMINSSLFDLLYIDKQVGLGNFPDNPPQYDNLSKQDAELIDINEVINYESNYLTTEEAKAILKTKVLIMGDSEPQRREISNGWGWNAQDDTDLGNEFYYRYKFNFWTYLVNIGALIILYFCLSYKNVRVIWELFTSKVLALIEATDVSSTQKVKRILIAIRDGYFALCFTALTLRLYVLFQSYLQTRSEIPGLARGIILLFVAWCAIDGANIMEKITGIDAGLSSASGKLIALYHGARGMAATAAGATGFMYQRSMAKSMREQAESLQNMARDNRSSEHAETNRSMEASVSGGMNNGNSSEQNTRQMEQEFAKTGNFGSEPDAPNGRHTEETGNRAEDMEKHTSSYDTGESSDPTKEQKEGSGKVPDTDRSASGMGNMPKANQQSKAESFEGGKQETKEQSQYDNANRKAQEMEQAMGDNMNPSTYASQKGMETAEGYKPAERMSEGNMFSRMENKYDSLRGNYGENVAEHKNMDRAVTNEHTGNKETEHRGRANYSHSQVMSQEGNTKIGNMGRAEETTVGTQRTKKTRKNRKDEQ